MIGKIKHQLLSSYVLFRIFMLAFLPGCRMIATDPSADKITSINIIDRNGMTETISSKDRLNSFQKTDFLSPQPYQKVLRVYGRDKSGDVHSYITSYHPNGQIKQYLESLNSRAYGIYREWHPNGKLKVESHIIGGMADIHTQAQESWIFDGKNIAWDEDGHLIAEIYYSKGELEGKSQYFHSNGNVWKSIPYTKNVIHGTEEVFLSDGTLFQTTSYHLGAKEGTSIRYWQNEKIAFQEEYEHGRLKEGVYYDNQEKVLSKIASGKGFKAIFGKEHLIELQEFKEGIQEGLVKVFDEAGKLCRAYSIKGGEKHGEEIDYYPNSEPKLLITWYEGVLQGPVKTWYNNGIMESHREMSQNKKNGLSTAWYRNGSLMLIEEYEQDKLVKGDYFRMNENTPVSNVDKGKGIATLFNAEGNFAKKIQYHEGKPLE